ncbi:MAG TPA: DUF1592 domain-containing protein [Polyangiaceae bacterium]|nr:DUF1592 domain-containing protein [Polyangiaceae bacterium]
MMRTCLLFGVLLVGCTGQIDDSASTGQPAPGGPDSSNATVSSTTDVATSGSSSATTTTGGDTTTQTTGAGGVGGGPVTEAAEVPRVARLTHFQWANSVQDLLRLDEKPTEVADFTPDAIIGFDTNRSQLRMSGTLREDYERAAEALAARVVDDPDALARLIPADAPSDPATRARAFVESFGLRAYRRPLSSAEVSQYLTLFEQAPELVPDRESFAAGVMLAIRLFLQSPHFLYRTELGQEELDGRIPLSGYEVASKLALAVTGSIPDDALLDAAAAGALDPGNNQAAVDIEAERLLATSRAKASSLHLHTQVLALSRYELIQKSSETYPEFTATTPASMRTSAELFLDALYDAGRGLKSLLTSTEAFVDANLAPIYGVSGSFGSDFQSVDLAALPRRGLLTQPGFLALFAGENQPDPIHRGVFVNQQILCLEIEPPGVVLPELPAVQPNQTNRQYIDSLTGRGTCGQSCHATRINPLGFAFENYDPLGRYRTTDNGLDVDASGTYELDGADVAFSNAVELVELMANSSEAHRCYASHWLAYLNGSTVDSSDAAVLDDLAARSNSEDLSAQDLIRSLVQSNSFLTRSAVQDL